MPLLVERLPAALSSVQETGTATAAPLPLSASAPAGRPGHTGQAAAGALRLAGGAAGGLPGRRGAAGPATLGLSGGTATGTQPTLVRTGTGTGSSLTFLQASGQGGKQVSGQAVMQVCPLAGKPASGFASKRASGHSVLLPAAALAADGSKGARGAARRPAALAVAAGRTEGVHREWRFEPPAAAKPVQLRPHSRLFGALAVGLTTWRDPAGQWHSAYSPNPDRLVGADPVYRGGYRHPLTPEARDALIAAGFADHVTLQEV